MSRIERGTFLQAVAGAATATVNFLYPGLTKAAGSGKMRTRTPAAAPQASTGIVRVLEGHDASYAGGAVVSKTSGGVVLQAGDITQAVRIPADASVWKEFDVIPDAIQLNDWLDVKGTPLADGSLQASSGWIFVNIARRDGTVQQMSPTNLTITDLQGRSEIWELSSKLDVVSVKDVSPFAGGLARLTPGTVIGAVGLRLPNGGFRATRVWA